MVTVTVTDADAAVDHLVELDDGGLLPFTWWQIGPRDGRVEVVVPSSDEQAARAFFAGHRLRRPDGAPVAVDVRVRAGLAWGSEPVHGARDHPDAEAVADLVGLDVNEAASRANAGGWVVRAHEPEAVLTAELRRNRVNLQYVAGGRVVSVRLG